MAENNSENKWYVVRAVSGQENKIKTYIENEISRLGMSSFVEEILVPQEKVVQIRKGKKITKDKTYFPGYIMIKANLSGEIPQSLGNLKIIRRLYLHTNRLSGMIPENICNLYENDLGSQLSFRPFLHNNNLCPGASGYPACIIEDHLGPQYCSP